MTATELRRALPFLLVPLLLLVAGCGLIGWELPGTGASPLPGGDTRVEVEANRAAWAATGIDDYQIELSFSCFCPARDPVRVTVVDGLATDVVRPDGVPADEWYRGFPLTVDALHERIATTLDNGGTAEVEWGADGVPARVALDPIPNAVDDELGVVVLGVTPSR